MERKRVIETKSKLIISQEGEVVKQEIDVYRKVLGKDSFMRVFLEDISGYIKITRADDFKVLFALWKLSEWNTGRLVLIKPIKEKIAKDISEDGNVKSVQVVSNSLARLVKLGLLIREATGVYYLNPDCFFKGYDSELNKTKEYVFTIRYKVEATEEEKEKEEKLKETIEKRNHLLKQLEELEKEFANEEV